MFTWRVTNVRLTLRHAACACIVMAAGLVFGCSDEEPAEDERCVVFGCPCEIDSDCDPALSCNAITGFCDGSGGTDDVGAAEDGGPGSDASSGDGGGTPDGGDDGGAGPDSDGGFEGDVEEALASLSEACEDACTTYERCVEGARCEVCTLIDGFIAELVASGEAEACGATWDVTARCIGDLAQSCNGATSFFGGEACTEEIPDNQACYSFIPDDVPPEGSGDDPPEGSAEGEPDGE